MKAVGARLSDPNPGCAILASDSRFTLAEGPLDTGQKVFEISPDAALVYAGDVLTAQRAIRDIRKYLAKRAGRPFIDPTPAVADLLRRARKEEIGRNSEGERPPVLSLHVLVGACAKSGAPQVIRFSSVSNFAPVHVTGLVAVGYARDVQEFQRQWEHYQTDLESRDELLWREDSWPIPVALSLRDTLRAASASTWIGGGVQMLHIKRRGISRITVKSTTDVKTWGEITVQPPTIKPLTVRQAAAAAAEDFDLSVLTIDE
jgi:hypothetical protein